MTIEQELIEIFAAGANERNRGILTGYYGWKDGRKHTLAEVGEEFGITRERARQICSKLVKREKPKSIPAPVVEAALRFVKKQVPCTLEAIERELTDRGLTAVGMRLESLAAAASLLERDVPFSVVTTEGPSLVVASGDERTPYLILETARKEVYFRGLSTVQRVRSQVTRRLGDLDYPVSASSITRKLVIESIRTEPSFRWLDKQESWFWFSSLRKHGIPHAIDKIMSVAESLTSAELRKAIARNPRLGDAPPPEGVLQELCLQTPGLHLQGNRISADPPKRWQDVLQGVELKLVEILREHGPVADRGAIEDLSVKSGMNRFSFHAFIAASPVIQQFGHSIYGLIGSKPSKAFLNRILDRRRHRTSSRVLADYRTNPDGTVEIDYRLSKAASTYAVITIPAKLKERIEGRFRLLAEDGREVGAIAARDGRAWGLGAYLRECSAHTKDFVSLKFDAENRTALVRLTRAR